MLLILIVLMIAIILLDIVLMFIGIHIIDGAYLGNKLIVIEEILLSLVLAWSLPSKVKINKNEKGDK